MKRSFGAMIGSLQRKLGPADVTLGEIAQELVLALKDLDAKYEFPWAYGETNLAIQPAVNAGTITVNPGNTTVDGTNTDFSTPLVNETWRLRVAGRTADWKVASVTNESRLVLAQAPNIPAQLLNVSYLLWKDEYAVPTDFQPGEQILLYQQESRIPIPYLTMSTLEEATMAMKTASTTVPIGYSDVGPNLIRFVPMVSGRQEFRFRYKRIPADFTALNATTSYPEGYDELVELVAEAKLRQMKGLGDQNALGRTTTKINALVRQFQTSGQEVAGGGGVMPDSSISQMGLSILPFEEE